MDFSGFADILNDFSASDSNSSKSNSDSSSNSAHENGKLEEITFLKENENTKIKRVWIVKKPISLADRHVDLLKLMYRKGTKYTQEGRSPGRTGAARGGDRPPKRCGKETGKGP